MRRAVERLRDILYILLLTQLSGTVIEIEPPLTRMSCFRRGSCFICKSLARLRGCCPTQCAPERRIFPGAR